MKQAWEDLKSFVTIAMILLHIISVKERQIKQK